jgi:hypothetical protein
MRLLGFKRIQNTLIYNQLVDLQSVDYVCEVAGTVDEAKELIEVGFEYVHNIGGSKLIRKRK